MTPWPDFLDRHPNPDAEIRLLRALIPKHPGPTAVIIAELAAQPGAGDDLVAELLRLLFRLCPETSRNVAAEQLGAGPN